MKLLTIVIAAVAAISLPSTVSAESSRSVIKRLPAMALEGKPLPFSKGVRAGDILYLSGEIGVDTNGVLPKTFEAQARNTLDRITTSLKGEKLTWKDITRCMIMLSDMSNWGSFNSVYSTYVDPANLPARSAMGTSGLALGALVEVQCEAYDPPS